MKFMRIWVRGEFSNTDWLLWDRGVSMFIETEGGRFTLSKCYIYGT